MYSTRVSFSYINQETSKYKNKKNKIKFERKQTNPEADLHELQ